MTDAVRRGWFTRGATDFALRELIKAHGPVIVDYDLIHDSYTWMALDDLPEQSRRNVEALRAALEAVAP